MENLTETNAIAAAKPWPYPDFDCRYYMFFARNNLLNEARKFIEKNPVPQYWAGGPWAWAHAEMEDVPGVDFEALDYDRGNTND